MRPSELSITWIMMRRMASKTMPPIWQKKPTQEKCISPALAMATPATMTTMLTRDVTSGLARPQTQDRRRTMTGAADLSIWMKGTDR